MEERSWTIELGGHTQNTFSPAPAHRIFIFFPTVFDCLGRAPPLPGRSPAGFSQGTGPAPHGCHGNASTHANFLRATRAPIGRGYSGAGRTGSSAPAPRFGARLVVPARPGRSERTRGALNDLLLGQNVSFPASQAADMCAGEGLFDQHFQVVSWEESLVSLCIHMTSLLSQTFSSHD